MLPLQQQHVFGSAAFWLGLLYVTLPLGLVLYGCNDLADVETDRLNPRKGSYLFGARGSQEQLVRLPKYILLVQVPFLCFFAAQLGWGKAVGWLAAVFAATAIYNVPRFGTKNWPVVDVLTQAGYLLVFVLSSWVNAKPQLPWYTFVFGGLFAMHSHLFGQIMDIVPDRNAGRRTTAVSFGVVPSKLLIVALLAIECWLVLVYANDRMVGCFLAAAATWFLLDALLLWRERLYAPWQMRFFLLGWNVAAVLSLPIVWQWGRLAGSF
jgi:4-hydroxybenzoate polyprenyltransferase